ncbi:MAG TPA: triose-phosphate isomerase [Candidatus Paceibacterota bacterium]|nr:triose-phosphate isomerase [Candidatus Paceibacterota bacterium]
MKKLIVANWKENPKTEARALALAKATLAVKRTVDLVICPPFVYLEAVEKCMKRARSTAALGAQDVFWEEKGAYTSEIGPKMLKRLGVRYVIVGHSERRHFLRETDAMINKKVKAALADGIRVILCVGEPLAVRKRGVSAAERFVRNQLSKDLRNLTSRLSYLTSHLIVAYEPLWAIGTGRNDTPEDAAKMARYIKGFLHAKFDIRNSIFLYGGSVNGDNIGKFIQYKEIGGALVGGASLHAKGFNTILRTTSQQS